MALCLVMMCFGIVGCPSAYVTASKAITSSIATKPSNGVYTAGGNNASPAPEPITLDTNWMWFGWFCSR